MAAESQAHWSRVYEKKSPGALSWYQAEPEPSLRALDRFGAESDSALIDVGGGASRLVDSLLARGWRDVTVLDIAEPALRAGRDRLGSLAGQVHWEVADITDWQASRHYEVWHDRAVFHFLTKAEQRQAYRSAIEGGVAPGGLVVMAAFALDGPEKCSGLPVCRYDADGLARELGPAFELLDGWREDHLTPAGTIQRFTWCAFRRR